MNSHNSLLTTYKRVNVDFLKNYIIILLPVDRSRKSVDGVTTLIYPGSEYTKGRENGSLDCSDSVHTTKPMSSSEKISENQKT